MRNDLFAENIKSPTLSIHGTSDKVIPYEHSLKLCDKMKSNHTYAQIIPVENRGHNNINSNFVIEFVKKFFKEIELIDYD